MKLSRQLFLVSLLTLSLPLAGFQYVRQMDGQLLQAQAQALLDRSVSLVFQLESNPQYFADLLPPPQAGSINFLNLQNRSDLDGNCDDWFTSSSAQSIAMDEASASVGFLAGRLGPDFYLCLQVADAEIQYHRANSGSLILGDHLVIHTDEQRYWLRTENPGALWAVSLNNAGEPLPEYNLNAFWRETDDGYRVEIRIPEYLASSRLAVEVVENGNSTLATLGLSHEGRPLKYIEVQNQLQAVIDLQQGAARTEAIYLLSTSGSLAASGVPELDDGIQPQGWLASLYELVSSQDFVGDLSYPKDTGFLDIDSVQASESSENVSWYRDGNARVARAYVPVEIGGLRVATLIADEPARTLSEINSAALTRLLWYTGSAFLVTSIGLIAYALWLSGRIRRLSRATSQLVRDDKKVKAEKGVFRPSKSKDELGELSRQYAEMVQRVDSYTQYLQSLSGKLSHEIRTPIAIVRSSLDNLEQAEDQPERDKYLERASDGIERLSSILSAMSQSTAIESAIESAERESFSPAAVLSDLTLAYKDIYPHIPFVSEISEQSGSGRVLGSADLFAQMLDKLVDNAADFCTGEIRLMLNIESDWIRLEVINEGPALPQGMAQNLFDSLVSFREGATRQGLGPEEASEKPHLGLGLFVVKRVVDFHRGKVEARNLPNDEGVQFVIWLPLITA